MGFLFDFITQFLAELFGRRRPDDDPRDDAPATSKGPLVVAGAGLVVLVVSLAVGANAVAAGAIVVVLVSALLTRGWHP